MNKQKIIFLDFDGVITTPESGWTIDIQKLELLNKLIITTDAKIVVTSSWKHGYENVDDFKNSIYKKNKRKNSPLFYNHNESVLERFTDQIYDITDSKGSWRGDEIERWLNKHEEEIESYVILDDDSDFHEDQLFHFVQTDLYEGITEREVKICINILKKQRVWNPIRMNLVLTTMWRNKCSGLEKNNIDNLISEYYQTIKK